MITDTIDNANLYTSIHRHFGVALQYLQQNDFSQVADGKYAINGKEIYAIVSTYQTKDIDDCIWEAHKNYIDIQCVLKGKERIFFAPLSSMRKKKDYDPETDFILLSGHGTSIDIAPGHFIIFFPDDAHMPCVAADERSTVRKIVIKVAV